MESNKSFSELEEKIKNSGSIPRFFHNLHKSIKKKEDSENSTFFKAVDFLYSYYIGGSLLEKDQIIFAEMNGGKEPHKLTFGNAFISPLFSLVPLAVGYLFNFSGELMGINALDITGEGIKYFTMGVMGYNVFRAFDSSINKRCWPAIGDVFIFINGYTCVEGKFKEFKEKNKIENRILYEPYRYMSNMI